VIPSQAPTPLRIFILKSNEDVVSQLGSVSMVQRQLLSRSTLPIKRFGSFDEFIASPTLASADVYIGRELSGVVLPVRWINRGANATVVIFGGAVSGSIGSVPIYSGIGVGSELPANMLLISDPTLQLSRDLTLGWYAGNKEWPNLQSDLSQLIVALAGGTSIVLFGGSGGGFAALDQGARIPGSTVVASNPQTNILKYYRAPVERYITHAWGGRGNFDLYARHDLVSTYASPVDCDVVLFQNMRDAFHLRYHFGPFKEACSNGNQVVGVTSDVGGGHKGLGPQEMVGLLNSVLSADGWPTLLSGLRGFFDAPIVEW